MTARKEDSPHPTFEPRYEMTTVAAKHMLWTISRKCFIKPSGCWYFSGRRNEDGYGIFQVGSELHRVHRLIYEYCIGELVEGLLILHDCDNPPCCNPNHLHIGDKKKNMIECLERMRGKNVKLTPDMVREIRRMRKDYRTPTKRLAERFGVSMDTIGEVLAGKTWGFVT